MDGNALIMTIGLPRAGKSTWSRSTGYPMVNPDSLRLAIHGKPWEPIHEPLVWSTAALMVKSLFIAGHKIVILDATNLHNDSRRIWEENSLWTVYYKIFNVPKETCIKRAIAGGREDLVDVIERMSSHAPLLPRGAKIWAY